MAKLYYIKVKDAEKGPYVKSQIKSLWDRAEITADTFYFCKGMDGWKPLLEMMEEESGWQMHDLFTTLGVELGRCFQQVQEGICWHDTPKTIV